MEEQKANGQGAVPELGKVDPGLARCFSCSCSLLIITDTYSTPLRNPQKICGD